MKTEINWDRFHEIQVIFKYSLCQGEVKMLTQEEIQEINNQMEAIIHSARRIDGLFNKAIGNFKC